MRALMLLAALVSFSAAAVDTGSTRLDRSRSGATGAAAAEQKSSVLDPLDVVAAQYWGLTLEEMERAKLLMRGPRGAFSDPRISPVEVLGVHARSDAERIKSLYGTALPSQSDEREIISVPLVGDDGTDAVNQVPKSMLTGIIRPRLEETLELVRDRFNASGFARYAGKHAVLVGGASQLQGAREVAARILGKQVRIGRPLGISGMPEATSGPAFAAIAGLLQYPQIEGGEAIDFQNLTPRKVAAGGYVARVGQWIRESF